MGKPGPDKEKRKESHVKVSQVEDYFSDENRASHLPQNGWFPLSHFPENTACFNSNRKPNPWWRNSQWSLPLFLVMPSLRFPVECWIELPRTKKLSFRCRFQLQLSSPTSLCKQHSGQRPWNGDVCGVARVSLRGCELHSLWAREFLPADSMWLRRLTPSFPFSSLLYLPSFLSLSLPSLLLPSLLFTISSFILFLSSLAFDSPFFSCLSLLPSTNECPLWARSTSKWSVYFYEKDSVVWLQKLQWGEIISE